MPPPLHAPHEAAPWCPKDAMQHKHAIAPLRSNIPRRKVRKGAQGTPLTMGPPRQSGANLLLQGPRSYNDLFGQECREPAHRAYRAPGHPQ